jgi:type I restriction enzyme, S subunit
MRQAKLKDLFDYLPKSKILAGDGLEEGAYPFYTSSENQTKYLNEYQHGPGCLIFGTGGKASVHFTTSHFSTSTDCIAIKPKPDVEIDAGYVFQYFRGNMQVLENGFKGAGLKHISKAYLTDIQIPYPEDIDNQRRIAHLLGKVEGLITQRKQHLQQLDDLLKSVFLEMFGDPVRNERGWTTEPLGGIASIERGRFSPRPRNDPKFFGGDYPFIQTGDITRSRGRLKEYTQTLNELGIKVSKEFKVGTIVIAIVGATIGETALLEIPTYAPDSVIGIRPHVTDGSEAIFIEYVLRFWKPVLRAKAPEAARANINIETLRPLTIVMPPDRALFSEAVVKVEKLKMTYQTSLSDLESLYGALSQRAFKGELDLSRVSLPGTLTKEDSAVISAAWPESTAAPTIDLPETDLLLQALNREQLKPLLQHWLEAYRGQLRGAVLSIEQFVAAAQTRIAELHPDDDFSLNAKDYDYIKGWVFDALKSGRLQQSRNISGRDENGEPVFGNVIELKVAQA